MAIAEVGAGSQRAVGTGAGAASVARAFPGNVAAGNMLIAAGSCYNSGGAPAAIVVSDSRSTVYTVLSFSSAPFRIFIAYGIALSSGACTVTVDPTGTCDMGFAIDEFSGVDTTIDVDGGGSTLINNAPTDSLTTLTADDLVIGICSWESNPTCTPGGSYTQIGETESTSFQPFNAVFRLVTTATSYSVDWSLSASVNWNVYTAAFKPGAVVEPAPFTLSNRGKVRPRPFAPGLAR